MKTYFINPPFPSKISREGRCMIEGSAWGTILPPISLVSCASIARNAGSAVYFSDCIAENIGILDLKNKIQEFQPDLVILNTTTPSIQNDLKMVNIIKTLNPDIKVGIIGIHASVLPDETFSLSEDLDYIIKREPEFVLQDLILALRNKKPLDQIAGLSYRLNGKIFHNQPRGFIKNLDLLPFPAWDLVDISKYKITFTDNSYLLIIPSRGCPYNCTFCNSKVYYGQQLRLRSPEKIVDEMEWIQKTFKVNDILFWAESFTVNKKFVMSICREIIRRNLHIRWISNSRVDNIDFEMLKQMKLAGCWMIAFGIESGNQTILDNAKKNITLKQSIEAVRLTEKLGLKISAHVIIGLPGETKETILETLNFVKRLNIDFIQFYCAVPFPGSYLYDLAKKNKWINSDNWSDFHQGYSILDTDTLSSSAVMTFRRKAYLSYYLRSKQIFKTLKQVRSLTEFRHFLSIAIRFMFWIK